MHDFEDYSKRGITMKRRIISMLLLVVMLISLFPVQAFAAEATTVDVTGTEMTVGGDSSFGSLLGNTVSEEQAKQSSGEEFECRITDLTVEGAQAVVEYSINTPATVVVAIYSDDGFTMLGSGTAAATMDNTWVAVDIEISKMPAYFTAGAFMLDPETNNPISEEFKTTRYTKAYMDIKAATVADFDPELVLNLDESMTTNFAVFNENTILADYTGDISVTENLDGTYLINNPDEKILAMQPGDTFAYTYADGTVLIIYAADVDVDEDGKSVLITEQTDAELSDVFDFVKIETDSFDKEVTYDDSGLPNGVEMVDASEVEMPDDASVAGLGDIPLADKKKSKSDSFGIKLNSTIGDNIKLTGAVKCDFTAYLEVFISWNYQNVTLSFENENSITVNLSASVENEIPFPAIDIHFLPGVTGHVEPKFIFKASASVDWYGKLTTTIKYVYDGDTGFSDASSGPTLKSELKIDGSIYVGLNFDIGISVISKKILTGGMNAEIGIELTMHEKIDFVEPETEIVHECLLCLDGELDAVFSLNVYLDILDGWKKPEKQLADKSFKLSDCYYSVDYGEFAFTKCPHISYKISVQILKGETPVETSVPLALYQNGQSVDTVYILDENCKPVKSDVPASGADFYLPNGKYKIVVELDGGRQEKEFTVKDGGKELKLVFEEKVSDYLLTISGTELEMNKGSTQQLNVYFKEKDVTRSCTWQSDNTSAATVSDGLVTAKAAGNAAISASYSVNGKNYSVTCKVTIISADSSDNIIGSGKCGDNLTWVFDDAGTLTISGAGAMYDYSSDNKATWRTYNAKITKLVINPGVTSIGSYAFQGCYEIADVDLPESIASIGDYAFDCCHGLTSFVIPDKVTSIGLSTFYNCSKLESVAIPNGVTSIGVSAFCACINLSEITIPENVTSIGANAFYGCSKLASITIPGKVATISNGAFYYCTGLTNLTISYGVSTIGEEAFLGCRSLTSVTIPSGVTVIDDNAFSWCSNLVSVYIPDSVIRIDLSAFCRCDSLTDVYYSGTEEEWDDISIDENNDDLTSATIHYSSDASTTSIADDDEDLEETESAVASVDGQTEKDVEETEPPVEEELEPLPEIEIEPEIAEEENPDEELGEDESSDVPAAAEQPELELAAAHTGTSGTSGKFKTAKFTNLEPGEEYVLIVSVNPSALLEPANLLYIAQDNAAADGTLTLSYIPRTDTPSAMVTLYGVPHDRYITLECEYITMKRGDSAVSVAAAVMPEEWSDYLTWSVNPGDEEIISVGENGKITPLAVGTGYAVATVSYKDYTFSARCRVDVTEKSAEEALKETEEDLEISGIQLGATSVTSELYSRNYAEFDIVLVLPQNVSAMESGSVTFEKPEDNGVAIKSARFTDSTVESLFDLVVVDDRRVAVVPKEESIENPKSVKGSYTSAVAVTVGNTEFATDTKIKLTVKKSTPKLKANSVQFNSFYSDQTSPIVITGATVKTVAIDTSKKNADWLTLDAESKTLTLNANAPQKSVSGSVYLKVYTEEWAISTPVTVSVKNNYKAPTIKLKKSSVTLNPAYSDSAAVDMVITPTDYVINAESVKIEVTPSKGASAGDIAAVLTEDGKLTVSVVNSKAFNKTYKVTVSIPNTNSKAVLTVKTNKENTEPTVTLKTSGAIDLSYPGSAVVITPTVKNYSGEFTNYEGTVTVKTGKTTGEPKPIDEYFDIEKNGNVLALTRKDGKELSVGSTYTAAITLKNDNAGVSATANAKITVKQTAVSLKLSKSSVSLNKLYGDSAEINVTCSLKNYALGDDMVIVNVADKTGKILYSEGNEPINAEYFGGKLYVTVTDKTVYGAAYKVLIKAKGNTKTTALTVTIPTEAKSKASVTLKAKGSIDTIRDDTKIVFTPTYKNTVSKPTKEVIEVYSGDGKKVYELDGLELTNFDAVSTTKYKAKVVATFENGQKAESPLVSITVKTGTAKMKATGTPTLYLKDKNSRGKFTLTSDDLTLNAIKDLKDGGVEIKDQKYKMFELYDYGNGQYAIGFKDNTVTAAAAKLKIVSIPINIRHKGNNTAKPDATVTLKVTIVK
jgi:hypothetical protein